MIKSNKRLSSKVRKHVPAKTHVVISNTLINYSKAIIFIIQANIGQPFFNGSKNQEILLL